MNRLLKMSHRTVSKWLIIDRLPHTTYRNLIIGRILKAAIACTVFVAFIVPIHAESLSQFRRYDVRSGMSSNTVKDIIQDRKGYMWFATKDGLNRFNGKEFNVFCSSSTGNGLNIDALCEHNREDKIWIASPEGLYLFDCNDETCEEVKPDGKKLKNVNCLKYDLGGNLWIGCNDGVYRFDSSSGRTSFYSCHISNRETIESKNEPLTIVKAIAVDSFGNVLVGHTTGLSKYIADNDCFGRNYQINPDERNNDYNAVTAILQTDMDKFLIGTQMGAVAEFSESTNSYRLMMPNEMQSKQIATARVFDFHHIAGSRYYVGMDNGMCILDMHDGSWKQCNNDISGQSTYKFASDKENGLWIGTYFCGANFCPAMLYKINRYTDSGRPGSLKGTAVSEFCDDGKGHLWIGTENGGLSRFDIRKETFEDYTNLLSYNNIHALYLDGDKLYVGTFSKGLDCLDLKTKRVKNFSNDRSDSTTLCNDFIYAIHKASDGMIYVGTLAGMSIFDPRTQKFKKVKELNNSFICDILEDGEGNIWAADRQQGLWMLPHQKNENWKHYCHDADNPKSLPDNYILRIYMDETERLWFCTEKKGICRYVPEDDSFVSYGIEQGLPYSIYYGILDDGTGNLWLSSNRGIVKYNPDTQKTQLYTYEDGMQSNQFNYRSSLKTADGKMYFGGVSGFNSFYPSRLSPNTVKPSVCISSVNVLYTGRNSGQTRIKPVSYGISDMNGNSVKKDGSMNGNNWDNRNSYNGGYRNSYNGSYRNSYNGGYRNSDHGNTIKLPHNAVSIEIHLDCLSYAAPARNLFSWKMDGISSDWIVTKSNVVTFSSLKPGKHRFSARASNNDGVWSDDLANLTIIVKPHPLLSWWAFTIYIFILAAVGYGLYRMVARRKKEKEEKKMIEAKIAFFNQIFNNVNAQSEEAVKEIVSNGDSDEKWTDQLNTIIRENLSNGDFTIEMLADKLYMSRTALQRKTKSMFGMSPNEYLRIVRLRAAAQLLETGKYRINEVCWMTGFNNFSYFTKVFTKMFGIRPKDYMTQAKRG